MRNYVITFTLANGLLATRISTSSPLAQPILVATRNWTWMAPNSAHWAIKTNFFLFWRKKKRTENLLISWYGWRFNDNLLECVITRGSVPLYRKRFYTKASSATFPTRPKDRTCALLGIYHCSLAHKKRFNQICRAFSLVMEFRRDLSVRSTPRSIIVLYWNTLMEATDWLSFGKDSPRLSFSTIWRRTWMGTRFF